MARAVDIMYCEGPGDIVAAHAAWVSNRDLGSETAITFSSQFFEFCRLQSFTYYALSYGSQARFVETETGAVTNLPRRNFRIPKIGYELTILIYTLRLLALALRVRPRVIMVTSGVTDWSYLLILRLCGAKIVPILHNALWPNQFRPKPRIRQRLHGFAWKHSVTFTMAVSPACARQVEAIAGKVPIVEFRPSFPRAAFADPPAPKKFSPDALSILFVGRMEEAKGAFDVLSIAEKLPQVRFTLCGDGQALPEITKQIRSRDLRNIEVCGRLDRHKLLERYRQAHVVIVPTRSTFAEGFAMVVAEAILQLRPVITSSVVPASEVFQDAIICVQTNHIDGYIDAIRSLNEEKYTYLVEKARAFRSEILNDASSFLTALTSQSQKFQ